MGLLGLAAVNPDAQIVRHAAAGHLEAPVDVVYLQSLSDDAAPAVAALPPGPLRDCLSTRPATRPDGWTSWNLGRHRALRASADRAGPAVGDAACAAVSR
ncbi:hypothetical protein GCM10025868_45220 [Angustibacter aerolatus]|uniref:Uncharacterized protein n=1 Tax=Angustibacter aerolatus TaxID=1162965 RepID=A0ABQ6JNF7_9ACTN|nr:DUF4153 domain-containing protein [Angustibacter aerolatus]GMA89272.1 hypothetical protein GCM10025868_45220 [Angustibacter aerolatus]